MKNEQKIKNLISKWKRLQNIIIETKLVYAEQDQITLQLEALGFKSGGGFELVDNYQGKNVAFKVAAVRRFELKAKRKAKIK